jgi:cell division protein FtsB
MSNKIASREGVFAVADGLKAQGEEPTYQRIIQILGGGSNSTIGPHLAAWKEKSGAPPRPVPTPVAIRSSILVEAVWSAALEEVQAEIEHAKRAAAADIDQANCALASSIAISEKLEAERDSLSAEVVTLRSDCLEARLGLRQVDDLKLALAQAQQYSEYRRREGETLQREIAMLRGEIATLKQHGELLLAQLGPTRPRPRTAPRRAGKATS